MTDGAAVVAGTLYVVATPIGNLGDLSPRATDILAGVTRVLCEDTRRTGRLLQSAGIRSRLESIHDHNEAARADSVVEWLQGGESLALVSDAGAPLVSDPGYRLVRAAVAGNIPVVPIPGPSAVVAALMGAGLPTDRFHFLGYLPARKGRARAALAEADGFRTTLVLFEAPHRIRATLTLLHEAFGDADACVARELTKLHEEFIRGSLADLIAHFESTAPRGEMTVVVDTRQPEPAEEIPTFRGQAAEMYDRLLSEGETPEEAARQTREVFG